MIHQETALSRKMLAWYDQNKRVLPFRGTRDPYRIWVSEIMLQQTRTETVGTYFTRFTDRFPTVFSLAEAKEEDVLKLWEGLGYYSRARNLHKAAKIIVSEYQGQFPADVDKLRALPGVGDYTAAAVGSIAFDIPAPAMDGNLTRVFSRVKGVREDVGAPTVKRKLLFLAQADMPGKRCGDFNQALMDLGATVCVPGTPDCESCPIRELCDAYREGDADLLPVKTASAPPREVKMAVVIVTYGGRVLMMKRQEALLKDLWVFPLLEGVRSKSEILKGLKALGVKAEFREKFGEARHVFTHRVWNMEIYHYIAQSPDRKAGEFITLRQMLERPLPTAMRAAKKEAEKLLTPCINRMEESQIQAYSAVYAKSWQEAHRLHCSPAFLQDHTPEYMEKILWGHRDFERKIYALSLCGEPAGILVLDEKENELVSLYIGPSFQGCGLGRAAAGFAVSALDKKRDMRVTALCDNRRAVELYRSLGFTRVKAVRTLNRERNVREMDLIRPASENK